MYQRRRLPCRTAYSPECEFDISSRASPRGALKGRDGIARAVYSAIHDRRLLVLHVKKTETTPPAAIEIALKRLKATK